MLVGELTRMMRDIVVGALQSAPDIEVAGDAANADLEHAIVRERADVVILAADAADVDRLPARLLAVHPRLKVMVIGADGGNATLYELRRSYIADPSPGALVDAIRRLVDGNST